MLLFLSCGIFPAHRSVQELLWTFLELQEDFLSQVEGDCDPSVSRAASSGGSSDEEVLSSEEEEQERKIASKEDKRSVLGLSAKSRKRKRKFDSEWDCEAEVESLHSRLRPYRNTVIANWNEKTRLASGKISSKVRQGVPSCGLVARNLFSFYRHTLR